MEEDEETADDPADYHGCGRVGKIRGDNYGRH